MDDPRLIPRASEVTKGTPAQICVPLVDLQRTPMGPRDRQCLMGDDIMVLGQQAGFSYVQRDTDGYVGYVSSNALGPRKPITHRVIARATHLYSAPDIKSAERNTLSFGAGLSALNETDAFIETAFGFVPKKALAPEPAALADITATARLFLNAPYLWGGNSATGIDCSGLVQASLQAAGRTCPGDSDQQAVQIGEVCAPGTPYQENDLLFWEGHVALVTGTQSLIHANAHHMAVVEEAIATAMDRIAQNVGPVTAHRRLAGR